MNIWFAKTWTCSWEAKAPLRDELTGFGPCLPRFLPHGQPQPNSHPLRVDGLSLLLPDSAVAHTPNTHPQSRTRRGAGFGEFMKEREPIAAAGKQLDTTILSVVHEVWRHSELRC